ncbi:MAG TPA: efflux RND transporter periplasmic adaptor subunit [Croceibacterium sp.]|nr:efflux RND transporter periplasmic adaptor subunit [Croceibacterium sp.]
MTNRTPAVIRHGLITLALALGACSAGGERDRPPPQVGFVVVQPAAVPVSVTLAGRTVAYETSEVRPQINGLVRRRLFTEGSYVRAGQPLYQIDASLYRAAVNQAEANLASARASADAAVARADRYKPLAEIEAVAAQDYTDAAAQARVARASVAQTAAALETARINLRYATITAPISGRIGRSLATVGALVSANQPDPLAVIQRLDPIYVDMQQSSAELTALRQALQRGEVTPGGTSVRLTLEDGSAYGYAGRVQFSDIAVDESTGTVTVRASFPNPQGMLLPGMFVKAVFDQAIEPRAFLVPQPALQRDFDGSAFVYVVSRENKALRRKVTAARTSGTNWVVTEGLQPGDKVITQGLGNNIKHDSEVRPVPASAPQKIAPGGPGGPGGSGRPGSGPAR